ncbi:hypothetical protein V1477_016250 [Vespula maculifrons]|uniref:Uncharacterized protein n=3 Tax=Vespula TaxID=7451 RepID=A0A834P2E6_VESPE|nr:hypothetical protein HZH66_006749 [Vespula vulgaris]KAF7425633.1 hypothetical protein H0235_008071 [Vespula pensylvanica]
MSENALTGVSGALKASNLDRLASSKTKETFHDTRLFAKEESAGRNYHWHDPRIRIACKSVLSTSSPRLHAWYFLPSHLRNSLIATFPLLWITYLALSKSLFALANFYQLN